MTYAITAILGDYYHDEKLSSMALENALQLSKEDANITYIAPDRLLENLQEKPDVIILFKENRLNPQDDNIKSWMNKEIALAITAYVENGGAWLAWHSGMAEYENVDRYISMLRGYFNFHPEKHQIIEYEPAPGSKTIGKGETFRFLDEHYFVECDEENTNVLLRSRSVDGESVAAWAHEYGKGRVFCLTPAHLEDGLMNTAFQQIMVNALKWLLFSRGTNKG